MATHPAIAPVKRLEATGDDGFDLLAFELVPQRALRPGDLVLCTPGDPVLGEAIAGLADVTDATVRAGYLVVRVSA